MYCTHENFGFIYQYNCICVALQICIWPGNIQYAVNNDTLHCHTCPLLIVPISSLLSNLKKGVCTMSNAVLKLKHHTRREPVLLISIHFAFVFCWNCLMLNGLYKPEMVSLYFSNGCSIFFIYITYYEVNFHKSPPSLAGYHPPQLVSWHWGMLCEESSWMNTRPIA